MRRLPELDLVALGIHEPAEATVVLLFTVLHDLGSPFGYLSERAVQVVDQEPRADVDPDRGLKFQGSALALQAALEGLGIVIIYPALVEQDLESGRLVILWPQADSLHGEAVFRIGD